jgi:hypothetical protein
MIKLPAETKTFIQSNESDLFGNIAVTRNITFDKKGYLRLSNSARAALSSAQDADLDETAAFVRSQDHGYLAVTHDQIFNIDADKVLGVLPAQNGDTDVPSGDVQSDAIFSGGLLVVTQDTDVDYYSPTPNTWTDTNISLTATTGSQHPVENFVSLSSVAIADVNTVKLYPSPLTATPTLSVTLTILADFYITGMTYFNQNLYIATMNRSGGHAFLYVWNGYGTAAQSAYEVDSNIIFDVCVHQDSIVCFTGKGQLLRFIGSGFTQLDALPTFYTDIVISDETNVNMYHNCLKSNGDILYINVSTNANLQRIANQPDGIWCYDSALGFMYHRYALSNSLVSIQSIEQASVVTATDTITVTSAPITGTEVIFNAVSASSPTPLVNGNRYFVIKVDATHIKLALTKTLALAGTAIDITAQSDGTTSLTFFPNTDFGQSIAPSRATAILPIERDIQYPQYGTDLLYGGNLYTSAMSSTDYLGTVTASVENRGYFVTPKIFSQNVTDTFNLITLKFSKFLSDTDKILIKYRTVDDRRDVITVDGSEWLATWTSTNTFTTAQVDFADAIVGDEIEFLQGGGSGMLAHITAISLDAGTYTVTIDEAYDYYTAGDKARFVFRNWKKWKTITYGDDNAEQGFISQELGVVGKFIQFKIELRGVQTQIEELSVDNKYHLPAQR